MPIFLDQDNLVFDNATLGQQARDACGDNKQCLFDIHTTGKVSIGEASKQALESFVAVINETETPGEGNVFYPMPRRILPIRSLESSCIFCGIQRVVFHESFPAFITTSKFSRRIPGSVRPHLLFYFASAKPNNSLKFDSLKFKSSENLILETEYL